MIRYKRFFLYGFVGWGLEAFWTGLGSLLSGDRNLSSHTSLWMFFIYGIAVFLEPIHDIIHEWKWFLRGLVWVVLIWGIEYASGMLFRDVLGVQPWYYTGPFAVDSLVRLDFAPAWFIAGLLFERAHRALDQYGIA